MLREPLDPLWCGADPLNIVRSLAEVIHIILHAVFPLLVPNSGLVAVDVSFGVSAWVSLPGSFPLPVTYQLPLHGFPNLEPLLWNAVANVSFSALVGEEDWFLRAT